MAPNIRELNSKVQELKAEVGVRKRRRQAGAENIVETISKLSPETLNRLAAYIPELDQIRLFSVEDIVNNDNGELKILQLAHMSLVKYLEDVLNEYEEYLKG